MIRSKRKRQFLMRLDTLLSKVQELQKIENGQSDIQLSCSLESIKQDLMFAYINIEGDFE